MAAVVVVDNAACRLLGRGCASRTCTFTYRHVDFGRTSRSLRRVQVMARPRRAQMCARSLDNATTLQMPDNSATNSQARHGHPARDQCRAAVSFASALLGRAATKERPQSCFASLLVVCKHAPCRSTQAVIQEHDEHLFTPFAVLRTSETTSAHTQAQHNMIYLTRSCSTALKTPKHHGNGKLGHNNCHACIGSCACRTTSFALLNGHSCCCSCAVASANDNHTFVG